LLPESKDSPAVEPISLLLAPEDRPPGGPTALLGEPPAVEPPARKATMGQIAVAVAFIAGYAALSHYSNSEPDAKGLATGLSVGPVLLIGAVLLWRWAHPLLAASVVALTGVLLFHYWQVLTQYYEWSDVAQQCGAYALVAISFGRSLSGGRVPICTQLSDKLHGPLAPAEVAYTRKATVAWTLFYTLLAAAVLLLFFVTPLRVWSLFVNFASFGLIGLMFIADHAIRRRVLPRRRGGILAALRQSLTGSG
jgi:uncharacterized membrane protein